jgi:hypothetical protein
LHQRENGLLDTIKLLKKCTIWIPWTRYNRHLTILQRQARETRAFSAALTIPLTERKKRKRTKPRSH